MDLDVGFDMVEVFGMIEILELFFHGFYELFIL